MPSKRIQKTTSVASDRKPPKPSKSSLIDQMTQDPPAKKSETTRFTLDLEPDFKHKLEILAQRTNRTKASVVKFLIDAAYSELEA